MMRKTLTPRIGYSEVIPTYERNLMDALMKPVRFDVFEYIVDEIWNIATNPLRSCGFAPYIQYMIEMMTKKKFYKDSRHDPLHSAVPKDLRASRAGSSAAPTAAPSRTTHSGGASSTSRTNNDFLKTFIGIFMMCRCTDQRLDVMEQCMQIVRRNQEIIHNQRDDPLQEFPDIPIFLPIPDPYTSQTPTKLAAFSIAPAHVSIDDDEEQADDDVETEDDE
jgi:hypothetical protein